MASARYQDEDMGDVQEARPSRLKSTVTAVRKQKGRGFREGDMDIDDDRSNAQQYESLQTTSKAGAGQKSVEGWVVFVSNVHEEASEEDVTEAFMEFGHVKNLYLNLDRRTGFVKGYALIEYEHQKQAQAAIEGMDGQPFLEQALSVTWCFTPGPNRRPRRGR